MWRKGGVNLTVQACKKALKEWGGEYRDITHTIGVTCTDATTPGYDLHVAEKLGLRQDVKRALLAGIGCAGGKKCQCTKCICETLLTLYTMN